MSQPSCQISCQTDFERRHRLLTSEPLALLQSAWADKEDSRSVARLVLLLGVLDTFFNHRRRLWHILSELTGWPRSALTVGTSSSLRSKTPNHSLSLAPWKQTLRMSAFMF